MIQTGVPCPFCTAKKIRKYGKDTWVPSYKIDRKYICPDCNNFFIASSAEKIEDGTMQIEPSSQTKISPYKISSHS